MANCCLGLSQVTRQSTTEAAAVRRTRTRTSRRRGRAITRRRPAGRLGTMAPTRPRRTAHWRKIEIAAPAPRSRRSPTPSSSSTRSRNAASSPSRPYTNGSRKFTIFPYTMYGWHIINFFRHVNCCCTWSNHTCHIICFAKIFLFFFTVYTTLYSFPVNRAQRNISRTVPNN